ncbi:hypothetical protein ABMA27_010465 [Loxostege sticticalis]|uniref:Uncharacterized protein n=1 Tax=Loxostege sticticalis TaxID=481309 RepID=A0ABR3H5T6_LOXSC
MIQCVISCEGPDHCQGIPNVRDSTPCHSRPTRHQVRRAAPPARHAGNTKERDHASDNSSKRCNYLRWECWDGPANAHARRAYPLVSVARKGGGRSFQQRDAANLKDPRNATVRCFFKYRYFGFIVVMTPNIIVVKCNFLRASIFNMLASLRYGVICDRGGTVKQNRVHIKEYDKRHGPYTASQ